MDDEKLEVGIEISPDSDDRLEKLHFQRELRGLEMKAYSGVMEALRASGKPNTEKDGIIKMLRDYFKVTEERHKAELRLLAVDDKLCLISEKLTGHAFVQEWGHQSQRIYVPFSQPQLSLFRSYPSSFTKKCTTIRDPLPTRKIKSERDDNDNEGSDAYSETEMELIDDIIETNPVCNGWLPPRQRSISVAVEPGTGNEEEIEKLETQVKKKSKGKKLTSFVPAKSPDITDTPGISNKGINKLGNATKNRGVKRKAAEDYNLVDHPATPKKASDLSLVRHKVKKPIRTQGKQKIVQRSLVHNSIDGRKAKESSEETSSADEGENGPLPLDESSRVMSPVFSEVIRTSVLNSGKATRPRGGVDRRKNSAQTSPVKLKSGKARPKTPNQKAGKFKNAVPTSGSRRKSKLNEKIDYDDVLMDLDGNEMETQVYASSSDEVPRRLMFDPQSLKEDCAIYTDSMPLNYHEDMEQVTDGVFKRPLPPSKGPKPWELKDARLSLRDETIGDENNGNTILYTDADGVHQQHQSPESSVMQSSNINNNNNNSEVPSGSPTTPTKHELPPPSKKQRIKSPLIVNPSINPPNVPKVPLPAPVFSTTLSSVNKKRQAKPISVVDSLNLHLPSSPTASSLAASSNNRRAGTGTGGGCSMFSNSTALIAGARGTAPGILQQQRKAQPHILANSKVHQRAFSPATNTVSNSTNSVSNNVHTPVTATPTMTAIPATSPVGAGSTAATHTVQIPTSPIPISTISTGPSPSTSLPLTFANSNSSNLNINATGVPIARTGTGPNLILLQKTNGPVVAGGTPIPNNVIPLKPQQRAVILRRSPLSRQGNVMILDMQKNPIVASGQPSPFLQTARILNAPGGELSLVNIQPSSSPIKVSPTSSIGSSPLTPTEACAVQALISPPQLHKPEGIVIQTSNAEAFLTQINHHQLNNAVVTSTAHANEADVAEHEVNEEGDATEPQAVPGDAEYAQIEAELMQMEEGGSFEDVVYEEEVTTEIVPLDDGERTQYIFTSDASTNAVDSESVTTTHDASSHNVSIVSGSSTDTASENDVSIQTLESPNGDRLALIQSTNEDHQLASVAVSQAISLRSISPTAKTLTFTTPITLGGTTFNVTSGEISTPTSITFSINSTEALTTPSFVDGESGTVVIENNDPSSTNIIHLENAETANSTVVLNSDKNDTVQGEVHTTEASNSS